ncbi:hypothetical protein Tco_0285839 [Tanacetum coccineum]
MSKKKNTEVPQPSGSTDNVPDENVPTTSNDPLLSGEDRLKLTELMDLCTNLQKKVLDLEKAKTTQDSEIASLKKKVKKLKRRNNQNSQGSKVKGRLGRKIADIDADAKVTLIDETQGRNDDNLMFDTGVLDEQEVEVEKESVLQSEYESTTTTTVDELTLAQTLIEIKAAKPKALTRQKEEEANIALFESWDNTQAMMDADYQMAQQLQAKEQEHLSTKLEQEVAKKQKIDNDQEEAEMKKLIKVVPDEEEVVIDVIPLATKPPSIVDWKIVKEGKIGLFQIIRANGSSKRSPVWRTLQNEKVFIWKLFDSCGVHFLRLQSMHLFMLVEKRYPLTPATITEMLNKKLQTDHLNEMCYQLLKLMTKQLKKQ